MQRQKLNVFFLRLKNRIIDYYYWIKYRIVPSSKYHLVRLKHLSPGWHDVDDRMLHACFELLSSFVEEEEGLDSFGGEEYIEVRKELLNLYNWWQEYVKIDSYNISYETETKLYETATENTKKLVSLRKYLWT